VRANRNNAKKSTGAISKRGKLIASTNSLAHGIFADMIMENEDPNELSALFEQLCKEWQAEGTREKILIMKMCTAHWRSRRVLRWEKQQARLQSLKLTSQEMQVPLQHDVYDVIIADPTHAVQNLDRILGRVKVARDEFVSSRRLSLERQHDLQTLPMRIWTSILMSYEFFQKDEMYFKHTRSPDDKRAYDDDTIEIMDNVLSRLATYKAALMDVEKRGQSVLQISIQPCLPDARDLELIARYDAALDRQFFKASDALERLQESRKGGNPTAELTGEMLPYENGAETSSPRP
jgi:hypothetical protein